MEEIGRCREVAIVESDKEYKFLNTTLIIHTKLHSYSNAATYAYTCISDIAVYINCTIFVLYIYIGSGLYSFFTLHELDPSWHSSQSAI